MAVRLLYFARPVTVSGSRPEGGEPLPFLSAQDAEEGAALLARLVGGAVAYQQLADPEHDVWEEPELLGVFGDVNEQIIWPQVA